MGRPDGIEAILRDVIRPRAAYVAALPDALAGGRGPLPPRPRARRWSGCGSTAPDFRPYPADVRRLLPVDIGELNRLYQLGFASWLPSSAIADGVYFGIRVSGRLVARGRDPRDQPAGASGRRRQRPDPRRLSWSRLRDRRHRRRDRRAAPDLRPGRPQRPLRQPAGAPGLPPARLRRARPLRGAPRPSPRLAVARPDRRRSAASSPAGRPPTDDRHRHPDRHAARPRRHRPRPRRRGRPPDRMGGARDARPAPDPAHALGGAAEIGDVVGGQRAGRWARNHLDQPTFRSVATVTCGQKKP